MAALLLVSALAALSTPSSASGSEAVKACSHLVVGEAVRVDLGRRCLVVRVAGREPREIELAVDDATRFTSAGRAIRLDDVHPGDRVLVSCSDAEDGRHLARLVRAGGARAAVPGPSPAPTGR
jgi:hypothetical protein